MKRNTQVGSLVENHLQQLKISLHRLVNEENALEEELDGVNVDSNRLGVTMTLEICRDQIQLVQSNKESWHAHCNVIL